jgi:hypothetical protein
MVMVWSSFAKEVVQERYNAYATCRDEDDPESFSSRHVASRRERDLSMLRHRIEMLYSDENYGVYIFIRYIAMELNLILIGNYGHNVLASPSPWDFLYTVSPDQPEHWQALQVDTILGRDESFVVRSLHESGGCMRFVQVED